MSFSRLLGCNDGVTQINIHREAEKGTDFLLCASLLLRDRNWQILHTLIGKYTSYNSVFLILAYVKNFFVIMKLKLKTIASDHHYLTGKHKRFNVTATENSQRMPKLSTRNCRL